MNGSGIHHVDLVVSSIERSLPFYRELLGAARLARDQRGRRRARRDDLVPAAAAARSIGLREAQSDRRRTTATASACTTSRSRRRRARAVDERAEWLRANGAMLESEPQEYTYMPGYYAVFFYDPDGMKLEILHVPALAA